MDEFVNELEAAISKYMLDVGRLSRAKPYFPGTVKYTRARTLNDGWDGTHDRVFRLKHGLPCVTVCEAHKKLFRGESVTASARSGVPSQARVTVCSCGVV